MKIKPSSKNVSHGISI